MCWRRSPPLFEELLILGDVHGPLRVRLLQQIGARLRVELPILQVSNPSQMSTRIRKGMCRVWRAADFFVTALSVPASLSPIIKTTYLKTTLI